MSSYKDLLAKSCKEWNCPDMMNRQKDKKKRIPFSSPLLNWATYGGIPRGMISEFFGMEGGGKSSTLLDIFANAVKVFNQEFEDEVEDMRNRVSSGKKEYAGQLEDLIDRGPKRCLYCDLEHSFENEWAKKMHITDDDIDVMAPPDVAAEVILQRLQEIVATGEIGLLAIDSVPSLVCQSELDKKYGERTVASLSGLMTIFMRKIVPLLTRYDCTLVLINQIRDNMDNPYVVNTPGGKAIKFYSALRMQFKLGAPVDFVGNELAQSASDPAGYLVNVRIVKQKSAPNDRKNASYYLMAQSGIRPDFDYAKLAINQYGIIKKGGAWFTLCDPTTGEVMEEDGRPLKINGQVKVYDYLLSHPEYYANLRKFIDDDINGVDGDKEDMEETAIADEYPFESN